MTSLLDCFSPFGKHYNNHKQLSLTVDAQQQSLYWVESNGYYLKSQVRILISLIVVLIAATCIIVDYIFAVEFFHQKPYTLFFFASLMTGFVLWIYFKYYKGFQLYGASDQGVWIATATSIVFHDFHDIDYFEQKKYGLEQYDIGFIRAFRVSPTDNDSKEAVPILVFELHAIPNSYLRMNQFRTWRQKALMNSP